MEEIVALSKAMGDINRVKIVTLIQREKEVCVCEVCDTLRLSQPLVSRYLKQLKDAGVLASRKEGKWVLYSITPSPSKLLQSYLEALHSEEKKIDPVVVCDRC